MSKIVIHNKLYLTPTDVFQLAADLATQIGLYCEQQFEALQKLGSKENTSLQPKIAGVPRGGLPVVFALASMSGSDYIGRAMPNFVDTIEEADILVDDLYDTGATEQKYKQLYPSKKMFFLVDKRKPVFADKWIVFPWEAVDRSKDNTIIGTLTNRLKERNVSFKSNDNISDHVSAAELDLVEQEVADRMQSVLGALLIDTDNDPNSRDTSKRVAKMFCREVYKGRYQPIPTLTDFPNTRKLDELYTVGPLSVRSSCSHHLCPIIGEAWVGIIPGERVLGLSKIARVFDWVASRGQIQEEFAIQIADKLEQVLRPKGLGIVIKATHSCMTWRGVREGTSSAMTTSVMRGALREKPEARAEFLSLIK